MNAYRSTRSTRIHRAWEVLKYILLWGLGLALLYLAFANQDFSDIQAILWNADYSWMSIILVITVANHIIRAYRWKMLLKPLGHHLSLFNAFVALMFGYLVHYAVPRLGEISRCAALNKSEDIPFQQSFGTVLTERVIDVICLLLLICLAFVLEYQVISEFFIENMLLPIFSGLQKVLHTSKLVIGLAAFLFLGGLGVLVYYGKRITATDRMDSLIEFLRKMWQGMISIWYIKSKGLFILYTIIIWVFYVLMTYLWFFSFTQTLHLSIRAGIVMSVIGSLGRLVPVQGGGMGAYHFLFAHGLLLYGVSQEYGGAMAILVHGFQTVYYLAIGGMATLVVMFQKKQGTSAKSWKNLWHMK
ncbi:lysylphosphatidylglycerol synthase transmembrane domain-containing protein [Rapidithrix thailandica]|uniref:Lysylphosphatidylglycerol synthase transmembrane domain-containing protein n=1 Tax=Rapidithrix thailandica TaxID=413964 RepID=A0AAW9S9C5_9BACT